MNINDSSLSKYKSNKTSLYRNPFRSGSVAETSSAKAPSTQAVPRSSELKPGQLIKGEIIDHRLREVTIRFDSEHPPVTARLEGDVLLSIGQKASFEVIEADSGQLVLKHIPENMTTVVNGTVQKALAASGFAINDRNKAIVEELLNHRMPIDKGTLQTLIRIAIAHKEASPLTLVLMYKNNIPLTSENIKQFEAYQQGTHPMLDSLKNIAEQLAKLVPSELPTSNAGPVTDAAVATILRTNQSLLDILYQSAFHEQPEGIGVKLSDYLAADQIHQLNQVMEQLQGKDSSSMSGAGYGILSGNETPHEVYQKLTALLGLSEEAGPEALLQALQSRLSPNHPLLQGLTKLFTQLPTDNPALTSLSDDFLVESSLSNSPLDNNFLADSISSKELVNQLPSSGAGIMGAPLSELLNAAERNALLDYIGQLPGAENLGTEDFKAQISAGSISTGDTLTYLHNLLASSKDNSSVRILLTPEYRTLLEKAFLSKWTITPKKLSEENSIQELYQGLKEDVEKLSQLTQAGKEILAKANLAEPVNQLKDNLNFMKVLNEMFTYVQLPVDFRDKTLHSDLYVFTNKKALKKGDEPLSVLLHLNMTHLGSLNVHIQMLHRNVKIMFMAEHSEVKELIKENLSRIEDALKEKGYQAFTEVEADYKKPDFSKDFIEQGAGEQTVHRYHFDIRT